VVGKWLNLEIFRGCCEEQKRKARSKVWKAVVEERPLGIHAGGMPRALL
jgi:predicted DNA-binding protein (UPF0251 family)